MRARPAFLLFLLLAPACLWRSYEEILRVHLDVLSSLADKAAGNAQAGYRPNNNDITELTYPAQRARQFIYQYRGYADRESYHRFEEALDGYEAFVGTIDAARADQTRWTAAQADVAARYDAWRAAAQQVREALEGGT